MLIIELLKHTILFFIVKKSLQKKHTSASFILLLFISCRQIHKDLTDLVPCKYYVDKNQLLDRKISVCSNCNYKKIVKALKITKIII